MRKFKINVNNKSYEVEVEEIGGAPVASPAPVAAPAAAPAAAAAPAPAAAPAAKSAAAAPAGATKVNAPMPGTIVSVNVSNGQSVKKGDVLCILEAMKMENEIVAPNDGTVAAVLVDKGAAVNSGDALIALG